MPTVYVPDVAIHLESRTCGECGIVFAMDAQYIARRKEDHKVWYCPNGHGRHFTGKSEAEGLRDQLAREKHWREQAEARVAEVRTQRDAVERRLRATKAVVTRTKKKIVAGRCPCCSFKFKDLASHMTTRHPNYDPEKAATAIEGKAE